MATSFKLQSFICVRSYGCNAALVIILIKAILWFVYYNILYNIGNPFITTWGACDMLKQQMIQDYCYRYQIAVVKLKTI